MKTCKCGCGETIPDKDDRGRLRTFAHGHGNKGKSNWWKRKETVLERTSHERAVKAKAGVSCCEWRYIGGCKGPLDVAHVDGDHFNNEPHNLLKLCRSHHFLLDNGRINPSEPKMPEFTISSNKRRYKWSGQPGGEALDANPET